MMAIPGVDTRPLKEREQQVDERLKAELPREVYEGLRGLFAQDRLKFFVLATTMKRETWDLFWRLYCDRIEQQVNEVFTRKETPPEKRGIFG
jgi:hypothetical protein